MAAIHELLKQVQDPALRARLTEEFARATQNKRIHASNAWFFILRA